MYATPCSSLGTVTRRAELDLGGPAPVPAPGDGGGLPEFWGSSSAFVTSNIPVCAYLEPATNITTTHNVRNDTELTIITSNCDSAKENIPVL